MSLSRKIILLQLCKLFTDLTEALSHRAYLSVKELKEMLHLNSSDALNVFFAKSAQEELAGAATWPWAKEALTHQGDR